MILSTLFAIDSQGNGVRVQASRQAEALERAGHSVVRLDPWRYVETRNLDVVQFYQGGLQLHAIESLHQFPGRLLVFAPIIDSNRGFAAYRVAAAVGNVVGAIATVPGEFRKQALRSDLTIVRSTHERERIVRGLGIDPSKVEIVLNGIDPVQNADPTLLRRTLDLPDEFVLHVSSYTQERKNAVRLVEAVGPLGYPLILAGTAVPGPVLNRLQGLTRRFPQVHMLPYVDEQTLHGLYAACRVFCLPSYHEGTGLVALEAAGLGAPIVITKHGGPPDYFQDMAEYVDPFDVENIRDAVRRAWEAPASDALRTHVLSNLTWDASARAMISAYAHRMPHG